MNRQEKIDAIYEKIARKDLSFGCKVLLWGNVKTLINYDGGVYPYSQYTLLGVDNLSILHEGHIDEIIGHPVMIGDVLDYFQENHTGILELYGVEYNSKGRINLPKNIFILWKNKRKPIDEQSDECIDFVHNLIFK